MLRRKYWISELAELSDVSTRTIRYYIHEGLLPQPEIHGKYAVFTDEYLHRLRLIKLLKDAYLPLNRIRDLLDALTDNEIVPLLNSFDKDPVSALSGLQALPMFEQTPVYSASRQPDEQTRESRSDALDYIQKLQKRGSRRELREINPDLSIVPPDQSAPPAPHAQKYQRESYTGGEEWRRIRLARGLELNVRQPVNESTQQLIDELIELARSRKLYYREVFHNASTRINPQDGRPADLQQRPHQPYPGDRAYRTRRKPRPRVYPAQPGTGHRPQRFDERRETGTGQGCSPADPGSVAAVRRRKHR